MSSLELKAPPMALALILALAMWATAASLPSLGVSVPWHELLGTTLSVIGGLLIWFAGTAFSRLRTTVNPTRPNATTSLAVSGAYRLSRNPMYLGALLVLGGWAVLLSHALAFLFLPVFVAYMNRFQITPEERALSNKFGAEYEAYKRSVRRWL